MGSRRRGVCRRGRRDQSTGRQYRRAPDERRGRGHVGYWTAADARGRGSTSDALRTLTGWFLREGGAVRVELLVEPANVGSVRVAEAAGFTREGLLRQRFNLRGRQADVAMYSMLAGDAAAATL